MEKTAGTMAVVKGSTSATAVEVDQEALCCPRCLQLLVPPVLQCAAGHLICSSCHDNLPDKNKCVSCFVKSFTPTSYSRCRAVEGILRSVRVACPNAIHGCTAGKMPHHEMAEHEKTCSIADSGGLPRSGLKMGPCGGRRGGVRDMDVRGVSRIREVFVWHRVDMVDAMCVIYERDDREEKTDKWGEPSIGLKPSKICLESDDYLIGVKGYIDHYKDMFIVRSLTFISNRHTFGPYGKEEGVAFDLPAAGGRIIGFHGRSGSYLDALGTYVKMAV